MPFIKKSFIIERLLPNVPIEKYIGQFVNLKKSGANYMCCCPFHHEKTPSCSITPSKQMFYCFGCKEHGNVIDFAMKYKNLSFPEAVEEVAQFAGIEVEYEKSSYQSKEKSDLFKEYYELMDRCASLFTKCLTSPEGIEGLKYFKENRALSDDTILKCRLGFAPKNPKFLQDNLCKSPDDIKKLTDLGMLVNGDYGVHAMYRNRVMIPIFDKRGRIISFGGRTMGDDKPKYMNTKETPIYRKRNELFGLYETLKNNNNRPPRIVVVEGYMDVISVRQAGCSYAVASLGTATTQEQITEMFRHTDKVVFCYDGDSAGRHAAWHALETVTPIMQEDKEIRFAFLPVEHDPDSLVRECGLKAFEEYLDKALSYPEFLILHKAESFNLKDPNELSVFVNETVKLVAKIPVASMRNVVLKLLAAPSGFSESQLYDMLKDCMEKQITDGKDNPLGEVPDNSGDAQQNLLKTPMRRLMAFIIQQPTVVATVYQDFDVDEFLSLCRRQDIRGLDFLEYILGLIEDNRSIMPSDIIELTRDTPNERIVRQLINAPLKTTIDKGVELTFVQKIDYFAELMSDVLTEPLKQRAQYLKMRISQGDRSALEEYTLMQTKILAREHNS